MDRTCRTLPPTILAQSYHQPVLRPDAIELALRHHRQSYQLLQWVNSVLSSDLVTFDQVHEAGSAADAAVQWISAHRKDIPPHLRPREEELYPFANFFSTYLLTSFDLKEDSCLRAAYCRCELCTWLFAAPHLRTKKLTSGDKRRAADLKSRRIRQLAVGLDVELAAGAEDELLRDPDIARDAAYSTYGRELVARLDGRIEGPAVLALWREFAWTTQGSPRKDFRLKARDILGAEARLVDRLRSR